MDCLVHGVAESDTTERLSLRAFRFLLDKMEIILTPLMINQVKVGDIHGANENTSINNLFS